MDEGRSRLSLIAERSSTLFIVTDWSDPVNGDVSDDNVSLTGVIVGGDLVVKEPDTGGRSSTNTRMS